MIQGKLQLVLGWTCFGLRVFSYSTPPFLTKNCPYTSSKSSSNLDIELRTSRTLLPSPKAELYELEHLKKVELRTWTQVRSTTKLNWCVNKWSFWSSWTESHGSHLKSLLPSWTERSLYLQHQIKVYHKMHIWSRFDHFHHYEYYHGYVSSILQHQKMIFHKIHIFDCKFC